MCQIFQTFFYIIFIIEISSTCYLQQSMPEALLPGVRFALSYETNSTSNNLCHYFKNNDSCSYERYSSLSGYCNNFAKPNLGAIGDTYNRLLNPAYSDGISSPRTSDLNQLPDPEIVATEVKKLINEKNLNHKFNIFLPAWGSLVANDLIGFGSVPSNVNCCSSSLDNLNSSQCYINLSNCKNYIRTSFAINEKNCLNYQREQMNTATSFLDASNIYQQNYKPKYDPYMMTTDQCCRCKEPGLVGELHRMMIKQHNRIAKEISDINIFWDQETIFNETRKILIALFQHITFSEFLPLVLNQNLINRFGLDLQQVYSDKYSEDTHPGTLNEFAVTAFSLFQSKFENYEANSSLDAKKLLNVPMQNNLKYWNTTNSNKFFEFEYFIHQGRDHGIPNYLTYLNFCEKKFFKELNMKFGEIEKKIVPSLYKIKTDIDLLTGLMLESPLNGSLFGPTFSCLLSLQFQNLKYSDRYFYENNMPKSLFSMDQINNIKQFSFSKLLCNTINVTKIQSNGFLIDPSNSILCDEIPGLNLQLWKSSEKNNKFKINIGKSVISSAVKKAREGVLLRQNFEYNSWLKNGGIDAKSPDGTAASFSKANKFALQLANTSIFYELASKELLNSVYFLKRPKRQIQSTFDIGDQNHVIETLQTLDVSNFIAQKISSANIADECEDLNYPCNINTQFRTLSGRCNNIQNSNWGRSLTTFSRLLPPQYEDGVSRPRYSSVSGAPLPNPRLISTVIHPDISNLHTRFSLMVMQYAQFLDHDLTLTPIHKGFHESIPKCRQCNSAQTVHPECNPFPVPPADHYYPEVNVTSGEQLCFPFMRSLPGQQNIGPREQINQNTPFLDASQIYGENNCVASKLRGFSGRLNSTIHPTKGKELLPQSPFHPECKSRSGLCFIAGDDRASEQPGLTALHTIFLREHNRIVEGLRGVNPHWNGDQLYEMARKIVVAQNQHITYNEFLPRILSWNAVNLYGLKLLKNGYYNEYNPTCNPSIFNEFAAAAFRIGHSLLRPHIPRLNANHHPVEPPLLLRDGFFKVDALLQPGIIDEISRGLVATPMETLDQFITGEVTNHLFEDRRIPFSGIDLIALNIQRGRDHGLPSYNNYRALCNLKRARTWQDLNREIPPEVIARLKKIYQSVEDIDLFPGAMTERPLQGGLVGPTLGCIIGIQFRQLRKCDRFWYENNGPTTRFTEPQLNEIRKTTLGKIVCENLEIQGDMQRAAFDLPTNFLNPRVSCQSMPQIDLGKWRENSQECLINGKTLKIGESSFPSPCTSCVCTAEGSQCASLRITDCLQLLKEWTEEEIRTDEICSSQCGEFLQSRIFSPSGVGLTPLARPLTGKTFKFPEVASTI